MRPKEEPLTSEKFKSLLVDEYASRAAFTDQREDGNDLSFSMLGLFGEVGSLLSVAKKKQRDQASYLGYADAVVEELGDVLWYLSSIARRTGLKLSDIANAALNGDDTLNADNKYLTFHQLQPAKIPIARKPAVKFEKTLLSLASEVGLLIALRQNSPKLENRDAAFPHLVTIMQRLVQASSDAGVTLEAAAVKNLHKIFDRWPRKRDFPSHFDENGDKEEQLPRRMTIDIYERTVRKKVFVFQRSNGVYVGDPLTDNAAEPDDYRFHDVFHYAYAAVMGWSPVFRALMRLKRKSDPKIDEIEDGARAILIEEGVTNWIFRQAQQLQLFKEIQRGGLPLDMLKHVREFVSGYESERCPLWVWEEAILQGYAAFRFLKANRRGRVQIDFSRRRLIVKELP